VQFLFLEVENDFAIRQWSAFFAFQFLFQLGMLATKRGQMIIVHIILLQSQTQRSVQRSKSRIAAYVLPIMIGLARIKNNSRPTARFLTMTIGLQSV
jgi:hypothetical protein